LDTDIKLKATAGTNDQSVSTDKFNVKVICKQVKLSYIPPKTIIIPESEDDFRLVSIINSFYTTQSHQSKCPVTFTIEKAGEDVTGQWLQVMSSTIMVPNSMYDSQTLNLVANIDGIASLPSNSFTVTVKCADLIKINPREKYEGTSSPELTWKGLTQSYKLPSEPKVCLT